jgi:hypothetical protein
MRAKNLLHRAGGLSVPSPLVGEGQAGGCHTARPIDLRREWLRHFPTPPAGLPLSPALPHKGGGSALCLSGDRDRRPAQLQRGLA